MSGWNLTVDIDPRDMKIIKLGSEIGISDLSFFNCEWYSDGSSIDYIHAEFWYKVAKP